MLIYLIFIVAVILCATLCWFYSDKVFFLIPLFIPFYFLHINFFGVDISPVELALIIFLITFFFRFKDFYNKKIQEIIQNKLPEYFWAILFLLVGGFLSVIFSDNFLSSLHALFAWFIEPILVFISGIKILSSTNPVRDPVRNIVSNGTKNKETFLRLLFLSYTLILTTSLIYFVLDIKDNGRLSGFYNSPNFLVMVLEIFLPIVVAFLFFRKNAFWQGLLFFLIIIASMVVFISTQSFGGALAIAAAGFWMLFFVSLKKRPATFYFAAILTGLCLFLFFIAVFNSGKIDRFLVGSSQSSINSRLPIWKASLNVLKNNWVLGIGPNSFLNEFHLKQKELGLDLDFLVVPQPHNIYLAFWLEGGVLGLVGFLWIVKNAFKNLIDKLKLENQKDLRWLAIGLGGSLMAILVHGFFDTPYFKIDLAYYFWVIILLIKIL